MMQKHILRKQGEKYTKDENGKLVLIDENLELDVD